MPVGIEPSSAQPRYPEWLRELVVQYIAEQGRAPSQKAVQRAYQKETGQMLNWEGVKAAISDAEAQKGDHSSASKDATQP
jgi:hypothetical protein